MSVSASRLKRFVLDAKATEGCPGSDSCNGNSLCVAEMARPHVDNYGVWQVGGLLGYNFGPVTITAWDTYVVSARNNLIADGASVPYIPGTRIRPSQLAVVCDTTCHKLLVGNVVMTNAMLEARQEGGAYRRVELITGQRRPRRWTAEKKARIVAESFEDRANISDVARRNGVDRTEVSPCSRFPQARAQRSRMSRVTA
jgi:hypothetical protein